MERRSPHGSIAALLAAVVLLLPAALAHRTQDHGTPPASEGSKEEPKKKQDEKPRRGLPITDDVVRKNCIGCHLDDGEGKLARLSYMRKTPEGWEISLKRMLRHGYVKLSPDDARHIVRYLAGNHGLAREEAAKAMYEVERRIHWSEDKEDKDLRETCGECHTLGRVFSERRDAEEWKLLKATHLAFFPLARWQAFQGQGDFSGIDWDSMSPAEADAEWERRTQNPGKDQADKVLEKLAKEYPLYTPEWESWHVNRRRVPLEGTWDVTGHEIGRGEIRGHATITSKGGDDYETSYELSIGGAAPLVRNGKAILYGGFEWRARGGTFAPGEPQEQREALLLSEDWNTLSGRMFSGEYGEVGLDVTLHRRVGRTAIVGIENRAVMIPSTGHVIELTGESFPTDLVATDFLAGDGVTVTKAERVSADRVRLTLDVARGAPRGLREISFRALRSQAEIVLYDTIDWIKVTPEQGLARIGGTMRPPQLERFEALAMNRGIDDELYTADDYVVRQAQAAWSIEEFPIREDDDDARFVGRIDANTGVFTPGLDGPNPARKWQANNIGDVYVVATCKLTVQDIPKKPKAGPTAPKEGAGPPKDGAAPPKDGDALAKDSAVPPVDDKTPPKMVEKEFRSRGRLLVMVPIYVNWDRYSWDVR